MAITHYQIQSQANGWRRRRIKTICSTMFHALNTSEYCLLSPLIWQTNFPCVGQRISKMAHICTTNKTCATLGCLLNRSSTVHRRSMFLILWAENCLKFLLLPFTIGRTQRSSATVNVPLEFVLTIEWITHTFTVRYELKSQFSGENVIYFDGHHLMCDHRHQRFHSVSTGCRYHFK